MSLLRSDSEFLRDLVREHSAILIDEGKGYLIRSRLEPLARREGDADVAGLVARLRDQPRGDLLRKVVEALIIHETSFFRDTHPFDALRDEVLPDLIGRRAAERRLRIWCAGCSTGQEPYSVAMLLRTSFPELASWDVKILGTDLSTDAVERARRGRYSQLDVNRGVPAAALVRFFRREGLEWTIGAEIRELLEFRPLNLVKAWPAIGPFDLVCLRNVLIYFAAETKRRILGKVAEVLRPDGLLLLGGAETTFHLDDSYERLGVGRCAFYRPRRGGRESAPPRAWALATPRGDA